MSTLQDLSASNKPQLDALVDLLERSIDGAATFARVETSLMELTNEAMRVVLERHLQSIADDLADELLIDGLHFRRHQPGSAIYFSLCGPLRVRRSTYRYTGQRNGPTKVPLELSAGLIHRATPAFAFSLAQSYARSTVRGIENDLRAACRVPPSRSTIDRLAKAIGTAVRHVDERIENVVRATEVIDRRVRAINIGLDRTTIPMQELDDGGKVIVRYRMAYVGTVCLSDARAEPVRTTRYAVPAHRGPSSIVRRMLADVAHALEEKPNVNVGIVQDGAPELWNILREAIKLHPVLGSVRIYKTFDFYHLMEYLARVLDVIKRSPAEKKRLLREWRHRLLHRRGSAKEIERWIRERGFSFGRHTRRFNEFLRVSGMYMSIHSLFRYPMLKRLGLQKGSGVTEGACKSLVTMRAKRSGQRWLPRGISAVCAIKSIVDSDRLESFWTIFARGFERDCVAA